MIQFSLLKLQEILNCDLIGEHKGRHISLIETDSRRLFGGKDTLFVALRGPSHDAHDHLPEVESKGGDLFLVEDASQLSSSSCALVVKNSLEALQTIAKHVRKQWSFPVVGITGSNGKTIVKEWLFQIMNSCYSVGRSPKSYNSQVGVPLSIIGIHEANDVALIEAGISRSGEMERLEHMISPTIGILTNIGSSHDEGFDSKSEKLKEKTKLFEQSEFVVFRNDDSLMKESQTLNSKGVSWGIDADYKVDLDVAVATGTISLQGPERAYSFRTSFQDQASLENLTHCIVLLLELDWEQEDIQESLSKLTNVSMRLEIKAGINNSQIIDDTYNNDLEGLKMALDHMDQQSFGLPKTLILSDLQQTGLPKDELYARVQSMIEDHKIQRLITVGEDVKSVINDAISYLTIEDLLADKQFSIDHELVLVKGARQFGFEKIVRHLEQKTHQTVLELDLQAILHNYHEFKSQLSDQTGLMVMVKAMAYGTGNLEVAQLLQYHGVDYLAVAYVDEGVELRKNGIHCPIMVMNVGEDTAGILKEFNLEPEIYSAKQLAKLIEHKSTIPAIHIKLDTGMHRLGFDPNETAELKRLLSQHEIEVASVFTHLAGSDESALDDFTVKQILVFDEAFKDICTVLKTTPKRHVCNSAGITRFPQAHYELVRLGIGLYGIGSTQSQQESLKQIGQLKSRITQIKSVPASETVGYNRSGTLSRASKIATVPIGYADGYDRRFGNGIGQMLVNGQKAPVIGNVCMDMTMLDVTDINVAENDEVIVFGPQNTIIEAAKSIGTIPYELLTNIGSRVKRIFVNDSQ